MNDPTQTTLFLHCACAGRGRILVRMREITPQIVNEIDVKVTYAQAHSESAYANDVNDVQYDTVPTSILNIGCASI